MGKFTEAAKKVVGGSKVIEDHEKIKTDLLIAAYPNGFTIDGADLVTTIDEKTKEPKQFCVFTIKEDPTKYASGGQALTEIVRDWMSGYEDGVELSNALKAEGGVKIKLEKTQTRGGNTFTSVTVLD